MNNCGIMNTLILSVFELRLEYATNHVDPMHAHDVKALGEKLTGECLAW